MDSKPLYLCCVERGTGETLYTPCGKDYSRGRSYYSQEYVSALQHESAVNWEAATSLAAENEELKRDMEAKDKRIAELEQRLATPVQASGWISWHGGMFRPVRSDTIIDVMFANGNVKPSICAGSVVFEWQKTPKDNQRITAYRLHRRGG